MLFLIIDINLINYADENTPYVATDKTEDVIRKLENDLIKFFKCFSENQKKANKNLCHLINVHISIKLNDIEIENHNCEKILRIKINLKLNFTEHPDELIKKPNRKGNTLPHLCLT